MAKARNIATKMRNQRGASMPLALLLFLVCAMATAVVLAAGTATAGRASQLVESDQLYYSATSAANVFRDELFGSGEGHLVTVAVKATSEADSAAELSVMTDDTVAKSGSYSVLERAALEGLFGSTTPDQSTLKEKWGKWADADLSSVSFSSSASATYNLACSGQDDLALTVVASVNDTGDLSFAFTEAGTANSARFTLSCDGDYEVGAIQTTENGVEYTIKYVTITWMPTSLRNA